MSTTQTTEKAEAHTAEQSATQTEAARIYWWNGRTMLLHVAKGCGRRRTLGYNLLRPSVIELTPRQLADSNFRACKRCIVGELAAAIAKAEKESL